MNNCKASPPAPYEELAEHYRLRAAFFREQGKEWAALTYELKAFLTADPKLHHLKVTVGAHDFVLTSRSPKQRAKIKHEVGIVNTPIDLV